MLVGRDLLGGGAVAARIGLQQHDERIPVLADPVGRMEFVSSGFAVNMRTKQVGQDLAAHVANRDRLGAVLELDDLARCGLEADIATRPRLENRGDHVGVGLAANRAKLRANELADRRHDLVHEAVYGGGTAHARSACAGGRNVATLRGELGHAVILEQYVSQWKVRLLRAASPTGGGSARPGVRLANYAARDMLVRSQPSFR